MVDRIGEEVDRTPQEWPQTKRSVCLPTLFQGAQVKDEQEKK